MKCDFCGDTSVLERSEIRNLAYKNSTISAEFAYSHCTACGEDFSTAAQAREADRNIADAKRKMEGLLPADAIVRLRRELHLTQEQASSLFGGGPNSFYKYERGEVIQSKALDLLMRASWECLPAREWLLRHSMLKGSGRP